MKITTQQKGDIGRAKTLIEKAAKLLQAIQDETCNSELSAALEEIGVSLGFAINEIDDNILA